MRDFKRFVVAIGGRWVMTGGGDLRFIHPVFVREVLCKANRKRASKTMLTWLRHLYSARQELRMAFGYEREN